MNDVVSIVLPFIVALLGIAYPILLQVSSKLEEKYRSPQILDFFGSERSRKIFILFLKISLALVLIRFFEFSPLVKINGINWLIENSADISLIISTVILIISFFFLVEKIFVYYTPSKFTSFMLNKHTQINDQFMQELVTRSISDVLLNYIRNQDKNSAISISDSIYEIFQSYRENHAGKPIEYPEEYYNLVNRVAEEIASLKNTRFRFLIPRTVGGLWLLGELRHYLISEKTYDYMWGNLLLAIEFKNDDMILSYWSVAEQYFTFQLKTIFPEYSNNKDNLEQINKDEVEQRNSERERFLEFQYALGGLLLYKKRYDCLRRILGYTSSEPPKYPLLPENVSNILSMYFKFNDSYTHKFDWISSKYPFPGMEGLKADDLIKYWISKYHAFLILWLYKLGPHYMYANPLSLPSPPNTLRDKRRWKEKLPDFRNMVEDLYQDTDLMSAVELDFLNDDWIKNHHLTAPLALVEEIIEGVGNSYENTVVTQTISERKRDDFYSTSETIIINTLEDLKKFTMDTPITSEYDSFLTRTGIVNWVVDKMAFADDQDTSFSNVESALAEKMSQVIRFNLSETFFRVKSDSYILNTNDVIKAIDRQNLNDDEFIIVNFGLRSIPEGMLNGISVLRYTGYLAELLDGSIYILKKEDLPKFFFNEMDEKNIEKYQLSELINKYSLFGSVLDLNQNSKLREELAPKHTEKDLRKFAMTNLSLNLEIQWKKNVKTLEIREYSRFREKGIPGQLSDVEKIW